MDDIIIKLNYLIPVLLFLANLITANNVHIDKDFIERDKVHIVAMTGSYFRGDANPVLMPDDELKFEPVTYTYYEQLSGYEHLKTLNIGYYFYSGAYTDDLTKVLNPDEKTIIHIPNVNSRESIGGTRFKHQEVDNILNELNNNSCRAEIIKNFLSRVNNFIKKYSKFKSYVLKADTLTKKNLFKKLTKPSSVSQ